MRIYFHQSVTTVAAAFAALVAMTTTEHREYSVVIVGAGASGLQCANDLIAGGLDHTSVLIVEAQRYKGGRIKETIDFVQVL